MKLKLIQTALALTLASAPFTPPVQAQSVPAPPPEQQPAQPPAPPEAQPQPAVPTQPQQGYPGQPQQGYNGQPQQGYPGQPQQGYPGQPQQGYPGQPQQGYPGQPQQGYQQPPYGYQPHPTMAPYGQPMGAPPGYHTHDGFFFRGTLGFGGGSHSLDMPDGETDGEYSGFAAALHLAVGGAVTENLIIYAELGVLTMPGPDVNHGGRYVGTESDRFSADTESIGGGVAYYFMPVNIYVSASLMFTELSLSYDDDVLTKSDTGVGFSAKVGKEWWVSQDWGLGGYVGFERAVMKQPREDVDLEYIEDSATWTTTGFTVGFSATYN